MISHKHQAVFIHIPKCAGETVNHMLNRSLEFIKVHQTYDITRQIDGLFPYKYYLDIVLKAKEISGSRIALKTALTHLKYLGKQVLEFNSDETRIPDEISGNFRIGAYRRMKRSINPGTWNNLYKFTFVRNPYDRAVSSWAFLTSESRGDFRIEMNFSDFIEKVINADFDSYQSILNTEQIADLEWHTMPQVIHLQNKIGKIDVDFVGKVEDFEKDLKFIFQQLQIADSGEEKVRVNSSGHKPYQTYYTKELKERVYSYYKADFESFGYDSTIL